VPVQDTELIHYFENAQKDSKPIGMHNYELYGIVNHSGGLGGGHYVCHVKQGDE
jgi:ubiquitin C-terminal hydrolase